MLLNYFLRFPGHPQTPSISPAPSTTTVTLPLSPTLHLLRATTPQHGWIWAPVSLQKITTISIATCSIAFVCRTGPMYRKAWQPQSLRPTAHQTVCIHMATTAISEGILQTQRCVTYKMHFEALCAKIQCHNWFIWMHLLYFSLDKRASSDRMHDWA